MDVLIMLVIIIIIIIIIMTIMTIIIGSNMPLVYIRNGD